MWNQRDEMMSAKRTQHEKAVSLIANRLSELTISSCLGQRSGTLESNLAEIKEFADEHGVPFDVDVAKLSINGISATDFWQSSSINC